MTEAPIPPRSSHRIQEGNKVSRRRRREIRASLAEAARSQGREVDDRYLERLTFAYMSDCPVDMRRWLASKFDPTFADAARHVATGRDKDGRRDMASSWAAGGFPNDAFIPQKAKRGSIA